VRGKIFITTDKHGLQSVVFFYVLPVFECCYLCTTKERANVRCTMALFGASGTAPLTCFRLFRQRLATI